MIKKYLKEKDFHPDSKLNWNEHVPVPQKKPSPFSPSNSYSSCEQKTKRLRWFGRLVQSLSELFYRLRRDKMKIYARLDSERVRVGERLGTSRRFPLSEFGSSVRFSRLRKKELTSYVHPI